MSTLFKPFVLLKLQPKNEEFMSFDKFLSSTLKIFKN